MKVSEEHEINDADKYVALVFVSREDGFLMEYNLQEFWLVELTFHSLQSFGLCQMKWNNG